MNLDIEKEILKIQEDVVTYNRRLDNMGDWYPDGNDIERLLDDIVLLLSLTSMYKQISANATPL